MSEETRLLDTSACVSTREASPESYWRENPSSHESSGASRYKRKYDLEKLGLPPGAREGPRGLDKHVITQVCCDTLRNL